MSATDPYISMPKAVEVSTFGPVEIIDLARVPYGDGEPVIRSLRIGGALFVHEGDLLALAGTASRPIAVPRGDEPFHQSKNAPKPCSEALS